jgi:hypothetical protein
VTTVHANVLRRVRENTVRLTAVGLEMDGEPFEEYETAMVL